MTDPVSGQMASQAVEAMAQQSGERGSSVNAISETDFSEAMEETQGSDGVDNVDSSDEVEQIEKIEEIDQVEPPEEIPTEDFVQRLLKDQSSIEAMMEQCLNGGEMGQEEMLQMQAVIYSYSQRMDLATKVVENATSGIKQVMNTQV